MFGIITVSLIGAATWFGMQRFYTQTHEDVTSPKTSTRLKKLWDYVETAVKDKKLGAAERALLTILRLDHKNTAAYNRLGILYAMQQNYEDAIECFDIASSLTPTVQTLYNLGLVNYEYGKYEQSAVALQKVVDLEPSAKRYIAYAKALQKLGNRRGVVEALEKAVEQDANAENTEMLAQAYESIKEHGKAEELRTKRAITQANKRRLPSTR